MPEAIALIRDLPNSNRTRAMALLEHLDRVGSEARLIVVREIEAAPEIEAAGIFRVELAHFGESGGVRSGGEEHCFLDAGLTLERFEEPEGRDYPYIVALRASK